jgi:Fungal N-terminal domain of STAND proteins
MEPLGVAASVVSIVVAALQSTKIFVQATKNIKGAGKEIQTVSRDVDAFGNVIISLIVLLEDPNVKTVIEHRPYIADVVNSLRDPIDGCQRLLTSILVKIPHLGAPSSDGKRRRTKHTNLKWALFLRSDIKELQIRLEAAKSTLLSALSVVSVYFPFDFLCDKQGI